MSDIERSFKEIGRRRGRGSEELVSNVLEMMAQNREIEGFEEIEPHSTLDYKGIDFYIMVDSQKFPFQVKSSRRGLKEARKKHPGISAIRARPGDSVEKVHNRLKSELGKARKRYRRN